MRFNRLYELIKWGNREDWWPQELLRWVVSPIVFPRKGVSSWDAHKQFWDQRTEELNEERRKRSAS